MNSISLTRKIDHGSFNQKPSLSLALRIPIDFFNFILLAFNLLPFFVLLLKVFGVLPPTGGGGDVLLPPFGMAYRRGRDRILLVEDINDGRGEGKDRISWDRIGRDLRYHAIGIGQGIG